MRRIDVKDVTVWILLLWSALLPSTRAAVAPVSEAAHSVTLLKPADPDFAALVDQQFPGLRSLPSAQAILSTSVLLRNSGAQPLKAYSLHWTFPATGGAPRVIYTLSIHEPVAQHLMTGQRTWLAPGQVRLVSPFFDLTPALYHSVPYTATRTASFANAAQAMATATSATPAGAANVTATLDCAVYGDGVYVGPDQSKLAERYQAERNAQRDEGLALIQLLDTGAPSTAITAHLNEVLLTGLSVTAGSEGSDLPQEAFYPHARGAAAESLLRIVEAGDLEALRNAASRLASLPPTRLLRAEGEPSGAVTPAGP